MSTTAGSTTTADVQLDPAGTVAATVDTDGGTAPLADATVVVVGPSPGSSGTTEQSQTAQTDTSGHVSLTGLSAGNYDLQVAGSDAHQTFTIGAGARSASPTLDVATGTVSGAVVDSGGNPVSGAQVSLADASGLVASTQTDGSGDYTFTPSAVGTFDVVAAGATVGVLVEPGVTTSPGTTTTVPTMHVGTASLTVSVTSGANPVDGASVVLSTGGSHDQPAAVGVTTGATGTVVVDNLTPGSYQLEVTDGTDASFLEAVTVAAGTNSRAVAMAGAGSIAGTVTAAAAPVPGGTVVATGSATGLAFSATTSAGGAYSFGNLPADTYGLAFSGNGDAPTDVGGVVVTAGTTTPVNANLLTTGSTLDVDLAAAGPGPLPGLTATLEDATGTPVAFQPLGAAVSTGDTSDQATFRPLTPGSYTLVVTGPGRATSTQPVTVTAGTTTVSVTAPAGELLPATVPAVAGAIAHAGSKLVVPVSELGALGSARGAATAAPGYWDSVKFFFQSWKNLIPNPAVGTGAAVSGDQQYSDALTLYSKIPGTQCVNPFTDRAQAYLQAAYQALSRWHGDYNYLQERTFINDLQLGGAVAGALASLAELAAAVLVAAPAIATLVGATVTAGAATQVAAALSLLSGAQIINQLQLGISNLDPNTIVNQVNNAVSIVTTAVEASLKDGTAAKVLAGRVGMVSNVVNVGSSTFSVFQALQTAMQELSTIAADGKAAQGNFANFIGIARANISRANTYQCPPHPPKPPPKPPVPVPVYHYPYPQNLRPNDPNSIIGSPGDGSAAQFVTPGTKLPYTVLFQNDGSAPATEVHVTMPLPAHTDPSSIELTGFGFGQTSVPLSGGQSFSRTLTGLGLANGDEVSAAGAYDPGSNTLTWTIEAVNPATGDVDGTPAGGFLPPDDPAGDGEGYVSFSVNADAGLTTGTTIDAQASIVFDKNAAIATPTWTNTIDADAPTTSVSALPTTSTGPFAVSWSGTDPGSGIASYDVYVSEDGGIFTPWQTATTATSATYTGVAGHTYAFVSTATDNVGNTEAFPATAPAPISVEPGTYTALSPVRICDTRAGDPSGLTGTAAQCDASTLAAGVPRAIDVAGDFGVPADATAVVLNVTAVDPKGKGYLSVFPTGQSPPTASNLNYAAGSVVPDLAEVGLGTGGQVSVVSHAASDVIVDLEGYVAASGTGAGLYVPLATPARICDTRTGDPSGLSGGAAQCDGTANAGTTLVTDSPHSVQVDGVGGVPATGVTAVVLNVTAVHPKARGFLTVYPGGESAPTASNLNFAPGQTVPNRVVVPVSASGAIDLVANEGTDALVDVSGWYTATGAVTGTGYDAEPAPVRICDTRAGNPSGLTGAASQCNGAGNAGAPLGAGRTMSVDVAGLAGVPTGATAVVLNVTAVSPSGQTHLTVFPGTSPPGASDLNPAPGEVEANLVTATVSATGTVNIFNYAGSVNVVVDVEGWYS